MFRRAAVLDPSTSLQSSIHREGREFEHPPLIIIMQVYLEKNKNIN